MLLRRIDLPDDGWYAGPTIVADVDPRTSRVATEEIFGPVLSVVRAESYDEAANLINTHEYGNGTAIFTRDGDAARAFADKLETMPISRARLTSISAALKFSHHLFGASGVKGMRRVVDVSGDGPNNAGEPVVPVRDELVADGIVINGLPIMLHTAVTTSFDISDLDQYYGNCVIGGPGAFMVPVKELKEFASAIRRKLLLEISGVDALVRVVPAQNSSPAEGFDCLTGEKRWRWYFDRIPN